MFICMCYCTYLYVLLIEMLPCTYTIGRRKKLWCQQISYIIFYINQLHAFKFLIKSNFAKRTWKLWLPRVEGTPRTKYSPKGLYSTYLLVLQAPVSHYFPVSTFFLNSPNFKLVPLLVKGKSIPGNKSAMWIVCSIFNRHPEINLSWFQIQISTK